MKFKITISVDIREVDIYGKEIRNGSIISQSKNVDCENFGRIGDILKELQEVGNASKTND